jgi:hypothetical protein
VEKYIDNYTVRTNQKYCCDPYEGHKKRISCAKVISSALSDDLLRLSGVRVIPGRKICRNYETKLRKCVNLPENLLPSVTVCEPTTEEVNLSTSDSIPQDMEKIATESGLPSTSRNPGQGNIEFLSHSKIDQNNDKLQIHTSLASEHSSDL